MSVLDELSWRGLIQDATEGAADHLAEPRSGYIGFDPTAPSLHVGHLVGVMNLVHFQRAGHRPIALVGGATGLIGDPSGKSAERNLLTAETAQENAEAIRAQLEPFLDFGAVANPARMRNNLDWLGETGLIDFLRDIGKHFSVNAMLRKESVKRRIESDESGISFTEFSYQLLQAYDFARLCADEDCTVQLGGSDQWGNITAGTDLIRRLHGREAHGVVFPLMTNSAGKKFGKTEEGAVWLDSDRTSPFRFYQFWINTTDEDAGRYLRIFTLMGQPEIEELEAAHAAEAWKREAQKVLAEKITRRVHGEDGLSRARRATDALFGGELDGLAAEEIADVFADVPSSVVAKSTLEGGGIGIVDLLAEAGVASSKGEARRAVEGGGIYVNAQRVESVDATVALDRAVEGRFLVLRKGKKSYHLVKVEST